MLTKGFYRHKYPVLKTGGNTCMAGMWGGKIMQESYCLLKTNFVDMIFNCKQNKACHIAAARFL
jgi:hypothetical protein